MKIESEAITEQLEKIRVQLGGERVLFIPVCAPIEIDEDLPPDAEISELFDDSGLLIYKGQPVFAYIRDHTVGDFSLHPAELRKVHFTVCQTLQQMEKQGRIERYRVINRDSNRYPIDIMERSRAVEKQVQLYPCQYCLGNVGYRCFRYEMPKEERRKIVKEFDAREAFPLLRQQFSMFRAAMANAKSAMLSTDYSRIWPKHSLEFRQSRKFICDDCTLDLSAHQRLIDAHHVNGDKPDIRYDNLLCLCKLCHQNRHSHYYHVNEADRRIIEEERKKQNIFK